jgi:pyrroloquinoline quinone biosynthesis protein B
MKMIVLRGGESTASPSRPFEACRGAPSRSHGTLALTPDGQHWALLNISPPVAHQLETDRRLRAQSGLADGDVRAIVLTDAQLDHGAGLLNMRDGAAIDLYATPAVFEDLTNTLQVLPVLQHYCPVHWRVIPVAGEADTAMFHVDGMPALEFTAVAATAAAPRHSPRHACPMMGDSVAMAVRQRDTGARLFCAPSPQPLSAAEVDWMRDADVVVINAEALGDTEADSAAWMEQLAAMPARRKLLLQPLHRQPPAGGLKRAQRQAESQGIEWAYDGMEITL